MLRLGVTNDADLAPLFFPFEAGWVEPPAGTVVQINTLAELEKDLVAGRLDIAPINPLTYALHADTLQMLPTPVRAADLAADSVFLISPRRLDQLERVRVAVSPNSSLAEGVMRIIAGRYYGITPELHPVNSEAQALDSLQGSSDICLISGEAAMRAVGWAKAKGYFVEDLTKAWWIMTGLPLPTYVLGVRQEWVSQEPDATNLARALMLTFRRALLHSQEQRPTLLERAQQRTGLPQDALENHYRAQRYELNEAHLRGLLEFYRRGAALGIVAMPKDFNFFPALATVAPAPLAPPRRTQPQPAPRPAPGTGRDRLRAVSNSNENEAESENGPEQPNKKRGPGSRRSEARARGLRVIKGGKDRREGGEEEEQGEKESSE